LKQPTKLAAIEGVAHTTKGAALHIGGIYVDGEVKGAIRIPNGLSILAYGDPNATVQGLDAVPVSDRPPVNVVRTSFQLMVAIGFALLGLGAWLGIAWRRRRALPRSRWFLRAAVLSGPAAVLALECGWVVTEVGRQPWIVYRVMRVRDAVSDASGLRYGYFLLIAVYTVLAIATFTVLRRLARTPLPVDAGSTPGGGIT
jgi:cytochrome d ubiquinol oxidase subunit I